jgi:ATP:ADP antiporter, AAA family
VEYEPAASERSLLERLLCIVSEVRAGEGRGVLLLALNVFLLMLAYYLLKTVREALILAGEGAEVKSYASAVQAVLLVGIVPAYAAFASRVNRLRLITWVTLLFTSNLILFWAFGVAGVREGVPFFVWVGIFNMLVMAQFWAFANDLHTEASGKRLFPPIMLGASLGAVAGGELAAHLFPVLGPYGLMLVSAALLLVCILVTRAIHRRATAKPAWAESARSSAPAASVEKPLAKTGVLELLASDKYLQSIALLMVLLNVVNTTGEYVLGKFVASEAFRIVGADESARTVFVGEFMGTYASLYSAAGMLLQMFAVSRIFRYIGVAGALFILPLIALTGYGLLIALPILSVVRWAKILENGTDYSIQNTARHALFLPTSREAKYKAKAAIDTLFVRSGDLIQAGIVFAGTTWLSLGVKGFAAVNVVLTFAWLAVAAAVAREYRRRSGEPAITVFPRVRATRVATP